MCITFFRIDAKEDVMLTKYFHNTSLKHTSVPRRGFLDGMASVLDIGGRYNSRLDYRYRVRVPKQVHLNSDAEAIWSDWAKVGLDIYNVSCEYKEK